MESIVMADMDVIIDFFPRREPSSSRVTDLIKYDQPAATAITVFELYAGATGLKRLEQIDKLIPTIPAFPIILDESIVAAKIYNDLKTKGNLIGNQDIFIAAICISRGLPLLVRNKNHFLRVSGLRLIDRERYIHTLRLLLFPDL